MSAPPAVGPCQIFLPFQLVVPVGQGELRESSGRLHKHQRCQQAVWQLRHLHLDQFGTGLPHGSQSTPIHFSHGLALEPGRHITHAELFRRGLPIPAQRRIQRAPVTGVRAVDDFQRECAVGDGAADGPHFVP